MQNLHPFQKVGLVVKLKQRDAAALAQRVTQALLEMGIEVYVSKESAPSIKKFAKRVKVVSKPLLHERVDLIVVLGGDGTYLGVARLMKVRSIPVLGINMGQLGFLTETKKEETFDTLKRVIESSRNGKNPITISERALFEVNLKRGKKTVYSGVVVNDVVISKGAIARIISLDLTVNGKFMCAMRADGVIVSTPTGSTAYSMAAGGPVVAPDVSAMVITAICPHSLTQRPMVICDQATLKIRLMKRPGHVLLTLDGQDAVSLQENDLVTIRRFKRHSLKLVSSPDRDYFGLLREKFQFGAR